MAEKWKTQDSARTMTRKYNEAVDEINQSLKWLKGQNTLNTERTLLEIDTGLSNADLDKLLGMSNKEV